MPEKKFNEEKERIGINSTVMSAYILQQMKQQEMEKEGGSGKHKQIEETQG